MSENAKWYVVHTYSGYENKVMTNLEKIVENRKMHDLIVDVRIPTEKVTKIRDDKTKEVERKTYPGYVFVKMVMTDETWYVIRNIRGCTGFVGPSSKPVPLSEEDVAKMGVETRTIEVNYAAGDNVRVTSGLFADQTGVVEAVDLDRQKVTVTVSMFGRETPVELDLDQVEVLEY